jgi:hypothetical protein
MIIDVVVHQGGSVNEFDGSSHRYDLVKYFATRRQIAQKDELGAHALTARTYDVVTRFVENGYITFDDAVELFFNSIEAVPNQMLYHMCLVHNFQFFLNAL